VADIGATLRNARIQRGLSIEQAAQDTRISPRFLEALEAEQFDSLPAPVYVRGFLRSYANYLRLDALPLMALLEGGGPPNAGPDAFVAGAPQMRPQAQSTRPDPFRTPPRPAPPPPVAPPPPPLVVDETVEDVWAPEEPVASSGAPAGIVPAVAEDEAPEYPPEEPVFRPRRVAGVLAEREPLERDSSRTARLLALAGGAAIIALVGVIAVLALSGRDDNSANPAGVATETPTRLAGTIIPVVSPTATPSASASPGASVSPSPGASVSPSPTGTPVPPTPTATTPAGPPAPTATPTVTPTPTATPVTPTPIPPTPTRTPIRIPSTFEECTPTGGALPFDCGPSPYLVVCTPGGGWFIDRGRNFPIPVGVPGWATKEAAGPAFGPALTAGQSNCQ
jgi:cytoskeletal protein RodZ